MNDFQIGNRPHGRNRSHGGNWTYGGRNGHGDAQRYVILFYGLGIIFLHFTCTSIN